MTMNGIATPTTENDRSVVVDMADPPSSKTRTTATLRPKRARRLSHAHLVRALTAMTVPNHTEENTRPFVNGTNTIDAVIATIARLTADLWPLARAAKYEAANTNTGVRKATGSATKPNTHKTCAPSQHTVRSNHRTSRRPRNASVSPTRKGPVRIAIGGVDDPGTGDGGCAD